MLENDLHPPLLLVLALVLGRTIGLRLLNVFAQVGRSDGANRTILASASVQRISAFVQSASGSLDVAGRSGLTRGVLEASLRRTFNISFKGEVAISEQRRQLDEVSGEMREEQRRRLDEVPEDAAYLASRREVCRVRDCTLLYVVQGAPMQPLRQLAPPFAELALALGDAIEREKWRSQPPVQLTLGRGEAVLSMSRPEWGTELRYTLRAAVVSAYPPRYPHTRLLRRSPFCAPTHGQRMPQLPVETAEAQRHFVVELLGEVVAGRALLTALAEAGVEGDGMISVDSSVDAATLSGTLRH
eukprot:SAG11_NODE_482_length_9072_cov_12.361306_3_plen_300_part_00